MKTMAALSGALAVLVLIGGGPGAASAAGPPTPDKLKRFEKAAGNRGCDAVPYDGHRKTCKKLSEAKERACGGFERCDYDAAKDLVKRIEAARAAMEAHEQSGQGPNDYSENQRRTLEEGLEELRAMMRAAGPRQAEALECERARRAVHRFFDRMEAEVRKEKPLGNRTYESHIKRIAIHFNDERSGHLLQIRAMAQAGQLCHKVQVLKVP